MKLGKASIMQTMAKQHKQGHQNKPSTQPLNKPAVQSPVTGKHGIPELQQTIGNQAVQRLLDPMARTNPGTNDHSTTVGPGQSSRSRAKPSGAWNKRQEIPYQITQTQEPSAKEPGSIQSYTTVVSVPFRAMIRRQPGHQPKSAQGSQAANPAARSDAGPKEENPKDSEYHAIFERMAQQAMARATSSAGTPSVGGGSSVPEAVQLAPESESAAAETAGAGAATGDQAGPPLRVPDIEIPALDEVGKNDSLISNFGHNPSISKGGDTPKGFGVTRSFSSTVTNVIIIPLPGMFIITGIFEHPITYQIRSGTGPDGQVDVNSATSGEITDTNYPTVAKDLTPDMSDLNGRPPRTQFWAEDLTTRHELVHANDDKNNGPLAARTASTWLDSQSAADETQVKTLLAGLPARFADALLAALSTEDGEKHAYGDGANSYLLRATAIKLLGAAGYYS
jgi:hypothetical protein